MTNDWPRSSLGEILRLERRPVKVIPDMKYAEVGIYSFGRGIFHKEPRSGLEVGDKDLYLIKDGDFILQITFAWEGAVGLATVDEDGMYGSVRFPTFRINDSLCLPHYLVNYFRTQQGRDQLLRISPAAGRNRVLSLKRIAEVSIPLPPLAEQERIVARIESLARRVEEARELRQGAVESCDALLRSIIFDRLNGIPTLTPMRDLVRLRVPDVVVKPDDVYQFAGVYCFGKGLFRGQRRIGCNFVLPADSTAYQRLCLSETYGLGRCTGRCTEECNGFVVSPEFPAFEIDESRVLSEVLDVYFRTPSVWPVLSGTSTGTNVRRRRLNPQDFLNYRLPLPPMSSQLKLRNVKAKVDELRRLQTATQKELDALMPSILDKAFKGEL